MNMGGIVYDSRTLEERALGLPAGTRPATVELNLITGELKHFEKVGGKLYEIITYLRRTYPKRDFKEPEKNVVTSWSDFYKKLKRIYSEHGVLGVLKFHFDAMARDIANDG